MASGGHWGRRDYFVSESILTYRSIYHEEYVSLSLTRGFQLANFQVIQKSTKISLFWGQKWPQKMVNVFVTSGSVWFNLLTHKKIIEFIITASKNKKPNGEVWMADRVEITEILSHTFWQKFREINGFTKEVTKELISRNILLVRENFAFFHTVTLWE